jgi:hypothetical protein
MPAFYGIRVWITGFPPRTLGAEIRDFIFCPLRGENVPHRRLVSLESELDRLGILIHSVFVHRVQDALKESYRPVDRSSAH